LVIIYILVFKKILDTVAEEGDDLETLSEKWKVVVSILTYYIFLKNSGN